MSLSVVLVVAGILLGIVAAILSPPLALVYAGAICFALGLLRDVKPEDHPE